MSHPEAKPGNRTHCTSSTDHWRDQGVLSDLYCLKSVYLLKLVFMTTLIGLI